MADVILVRKRHLRADLDRGHIGNKLFVSLFNHCLLLFERSDWVI